MSKKQNQILIVLFILILITLSISMTFAFFTTMNIRHESKNSKVSSVTMETLVFNAGEPLKIYANEFNFGKDMPTLESKSTSSVTLTAASDGRLSHHKYNVKLNITTNNFDYSLDSNKPELLLLIKKPDGEIVKNIDKLSFVTVNGYQGFDITKAQGEYMVASDYVIETSTSVTQDWESTVVFVNYSDNQDGNRGKTLAGTIQLYKTEEDTNG